MEIPMSDSLKSMGSLALVLAIIALPLLVPGAAILLGAIGWLIYYIYLAIDAMSFDPLRHLPEVHDRTASTVIATFVVLAAIGAIRGIQGILAMLIVWGPLILLPLYQTALGVGVFHQEGWRGYRKEHWTTARCDTTNSQRRLDCELYVPRAGKQLPSFEETTGVGVTRVIPYGSRI
jgi:hypothetical protein